MPGWGYFGFNCYRLATGEAATEAIGDREAILVMVEGKASVQGGGVDFGEISERISVWERTPSHAV